MNKNIIIKLINDFISSEMSDENILKFRNEYDNLMDNSRESLFLELGTDQYNILDDIYMLLEMYEEDDMIRKNDKHCINKETLYSHVLDKYQEFCGF